jgi:hypothetical protein
MTTASTLLKANLNRVFNERNASRRAQAIQELYAADAIFYEGEDSSSGTEAIARAVTRLLDALPPTLTFSMAAPPMQNHAMGKLLWTGHLGDGTTVVTGTDIAQIENGRIRSLHVFVDASGQQRRARDHEARGTGARHVGPEKGDGVGGDQVHVPEEVLRDSLNGGGP